MTLIVQVVVRVAHPIRTILRAFFIFAVVKSFFGLFVPFQLGRYFGAHYGIKPIVNIGRIVYLHAFICTGNVRTDDFGSLGFCGLIRWFTVREAAQLTVFGMAYRLPTSIVTTLILINRVDWARVVMRDVGFLELQPSMRAMSGLLLEGLVVFGSAFMSNFQCICKFAVGGPASGQCAISDSLTCARLIR